MTRRALPNRRKNNTFAVTVPGYNAEVLVTVGYFDDDSPAEVFVSGAKAGTGVDAILRDAAVILSIAMQYGVPLETLRGAVTRNGDESASSVMGVLIDKLVAEPKRRPPPAGMPAPRPPVPSGPSPAAVEAVH